MTQQIFQEKINLDATVLKVCLSPATLVRQHLHTNQTKLQGTWNQCILKLV